MRLLAWWHVGTYKPAPCSLAHGRSACEIGAVEIDAVGTIARCQEIHDLTALLRQAGGREWRIVVTGGIAGCPGHYHILEG